MRYAELEGGTLSCVGGVYGSGVVRYCGIRECVVAAVLAVAAVGCSGGQSTTGPTSRAGSSDQTTVQTPPPARLEAPASLKGFGSVGQVGVGSSPYQVVAAFGSAWVSVDRAVVRVDVRTRRATRIAVAGASEWSSVAASPSAIWVSQSEGHISEVDPQTNRAVRVFEAPYRPWPVRDIAVSSRRIWVSLDAPTDVPRLVALTLSGRVVGRYSLPPGPLAASRSVAWLGDPQGLYRLTASTVTRVPEVPGGFDITQLTAADGQVWALGSARSNTDPTRRIVIQLAGRRVRGVSTATVGDAGADGVIAVGNGVLWTASGPSGNSKAKPGELG